MSVFAQVKALFKIRKEVKRMPSMSELKTSEGRLALLGSIIAIYSAIQNFIPPMLAAKISAGLGVAYIVGRALVKFGEAVAPLTKNTKDDAVVNELEKLLEKLPK